MTTMLGDLLRSTGGLLGLIIAVGVLGPPLPLHRGLPDIRLDQVTFLILVIVSGLKFPIKNIQEHHLRTIIKIFVAFALSIMVSILYAITFLKYRFSFRDLTEYLTIGEYFLAYTLAATWKNANITSIKRIAIVGIACALVVALFGFAQLYNPGQINTWLTPLYTAPTQMEGLIGGLHRTVGTFGNPNVLGFFMVIVLTYLVSWIYNQTPDRQRWLIWVELLFVFICLTALFMTLSRAATMVIAMVLIYLSLSKLISDRFSKRAILLAFTMLVITITALLLAPQSFLFRMAEGANFTKSTSVAGRIEQWGTAWELIRVSPIFGWGTAKGFLTTIVDNEYILIWRRYGLVGLSIFLTFWIYFIRENYILLKQSSHPIIKTLAQGGLAVTAGILIFDLSSGIFYNLQVMPLYLVAMGITHSWLHYKGATE